MTNQKLSFPFTGFSHTMLPVIKKNVFRMGVAGSYGIDSADIRWAAEHGVNYWVWGRGFGKVTDGIREVIKNDRILFYASDAKSPLRSAKEMIR